MAKIYRPKLPFGTLFFEVEADYDQEMKQTLQKVGNCDCDDFSFEMKRSGKQKRLLYLIPFFNQEFYFFEAKQKIKRIEFRAGSD
ncbi:MAG TPA: hypothetical protein PKY08_01865 [Candidatus Magasanikbacteria bacterium]|nr:hypothetical protein [Candidatus Magasanikbacteria bacterium]